MIASRVPIARGGLSNRAFAALDAFCRRPRALRLLPDSTHFVVAFPGHVAF